MAAAERIPGDAAPVLSALAAEPLAGRAGAPLRLLLLGATGRSGAPFLAQALARGHAVTVLVRDPARLPAGLPEAGRLRVLTGALGEAGVIQDSWAAEGPPDAVVAMLSSEAAPHKAVSAGTRGVLEALRQARGAARAVPFVSIGAWGMGPSAPHVTSPFARLVIAAARRSFWVGPWADFEAQFADLAAARAEGLVRPIIILPPILTRGPRTDSYLAGDPLAMRGVMRVTSTVARASIADLALKLAEQAVAGRAVPGWVAIREVPRRGRA